jgi:hypothetical protein
VLAYLRFHLSGWLKSHKSVEVLWDRGIKREFKWGSVVFGNLEGQTIGQKPTEAAPEPERECFFSSRGFRSLSCVVTLDQVGTSFQLPRPCATSGATSTAGTAADLQTAHVPYQPRTGAYPYAIGSWGYHFPQFPNTTVSSSVTNAGATQGDSVASIMASGTFPYAYTAAQYTPGQPAYVPPVKYPYGAPAMPAVSSATHRGYTNVFHRSDTGTAIQWHSVETTL